MAMVTNTKGGPMGNINITPMVDVLLVLLIIFMVITPLTPKGLQTLIPQPPTKHEQQPQDERTVVVDVKADGSLDINQQPIALADLQQRLEDIFKTRAERVVFVKGAPNLDFRAVAQVIDIAQGAGIDKIGLLTDKSENPT